MSEGADDRAAQGHGGTNAVALAAAGRFREAERMARVQVAAQAQPLSEVDASALAWLADLERGLHAKAWRTVQELTSTVPPAGSLEPFSEASLHTCARQARALAESGARIDRREVEGAAEELDAMGEPSSGAAFAAEWFAQRGTLHVMAGEDDAARDRLREAVARDPHHLRAHVNLGNVHLEAGDVDAAIAHYEAALAIDEGYPSALHNLGVAYRRAGNVAKSVRALRKAASAQRRNDTKVARTEAAEWTQRRGTTLLRNVAIGLAVIILGIWLASR